MPQKVPLADLNLTIRIVMISRTKEMMLTIKFLPFVKGRSDPERGRSTCESAWTPLSWVIIMMGVARFELQRIMIMIVDDEKTNDSTFPPFREPH